MKKLLPIFAILFLVGTGCEKDLKVPLENADQSVAVQEQKATQNNEPQQVDDRFVVPKYTPTKQSTTYINSALGFSVVIPAGWYLPNAQDRDPHFYSGQNCIAGEWIDCMGFEIQTGAGLAINSVFQEAKTDGRLPERNDSLIPDAVVIKSLAPGAARGWTHEYDVFSTTKDQAYVILANSEKLETQVLASFELLK